MFLIEDDLYSIHFTLGVMYNVEKNNTATVECLCVLIL